MPIATPAYKRILLKLSGEALMGEDSFGINRTTIVRMVEEVAEITRMGGRSGGGDWWRQYFFAVSLAVPSAWIAPRPTTWACWPR